MITIGIDPHKSSLTAVALDQTGRTLATRQIAINTAAYTTLTGWTARWPERRFAVEGAAGLGRGIAQLLADEDVVDVPATLAARARLLDTGGTRKTDAADAASVAHAAMRHKKLRPVVALRMPRLRRHAVACCSHASAPARADSIRPWGAPL
ncbi:IS110 family transposase [Dactylosporangium sp. McL0621]|uniref:IS110 family transposase n=1 Tax=Dactylosporangium sp. McL0621 TaxID=3415678 RepID=UPI003CE8874A